MSWDKIRPLWRHYYANTAGVIFVVDSSDKDRLTGEQSAQEELGNLLKEDDLRDAVVLVFANKQDLPGAAPVDQVSKALKLDQLVNKKWFIQGCCATDGSGLYEGLDWLSRSLSE